MILTKVAGTSGNGWSKKSKVNADRWVVRKGPMVMRRFGFRHPMDSVRWVGRFRPGRVSYWVEGSLLVRAGSVYSRR